jgi:hypothetical protein
MALHHPQRGAVPELRSGLRGRPEMRIVHCREGVPHCILSPEPQVERLFRLAFQCLGRPMSSALEPRIVRVTAEGDLAALFWRRVRGRQPGYR